MRGPAESVFDSCAHYNPWYYYQNRKTYLTKLNLNIRYNIIEFYIIDFVILNKISSSPQPNRIYRAIVLVSAHNALKTRLCRYNPSIKIHE